MTTSYAIDGQHRLVVSRGWGVVTDEELFDHYMRLRSDPAFDPTYRQLIELREVLRFDTGPDAVEVVAALHVFSPGVRRAIVASTAEAHGRARRFAILAERQDQLIEVFDTAQAALDWLDG